MLQTTVMRVHYKHCTIWPGLHLSQLVHVKTILDLHFQFN